MKPSIVYCISLFLLGSSLNIFSQEIINEGFDKDTIAPNGWIFSIGGTYSTSGYSGTNVPAIKFDESDQFVETKSFTGANKLSFFVRGNNTDSLSAMVIKFKADDRWYKLDSILNLPKTKSILTRELPDNCTKIRFVYYKSKGNLSFDDIIIYGAGNNVLNKNTIITPELTIWPNPASDHINIRIDERTIDSSTKIYISTLEGKKLFQWKYTNECNLFINLPVLPDGMYIISVLYCNYTVNKKIFVKKQLKS